MKNILGKNTKPEMLLRSALHKRGFRYSLHRRDLPGKPDLVFASKKIVIFVHGCFWHYHQDCREGRILSSNSEFWKKKFLRNVERDSQHVGKLKALGWQVITIWECEIEKRLPQVIDKLEQKLNLNKINK